MEIFRLLFVLSILHSSDAIKCFKCNGGNLAECTKKMSTCKKFHNRCLSLLLEGGERGKIYYKGCGTSGGCIEKGLGKKCKFYKGIYKVGSCRPSCCPVDGCNHGSRYLMSWPVVTLLVASGLILIF